MADYQIDQKPGENLLHYYRRLAKTADQRLVRLEDISDKPGFKTATKWAYGRATKDIAKWNKYQSEMDPKFKVKKLRFNTALPQDPEKLLAKIGDIKNFLESQTSTKSGIVKVYKKRAATFNLKKPRSKDHKGGYGTKFTWEQLAKYYTKDWNKLWEEKFGSKTALRTIAQLQKNKEGVLKAIKEADKKDIRLADYGIEVDTKILEKEVLKALKDDSLHIEELI